MIFALKLIDGVIKRIARLKYSNGTEVERIYPIDSDIPEDVKVVKATDLKIDMGIYRHNPHYYNHLMGL